MTVICPRVHSSSNTHPLQKQQQKQGCLPCSLFFPLIRRSKQQCSHGSSSTSFHPHSDSAAIHDDDDDDDDDLLHDSYDLSQKPPPFRHHLSSADPPHHLTSIVWRDGLLQSLGRLHSSGNCKLSLGELLDLDGDDAYLEDHNQRSLPASARIQSVRDSKEWNSSRSSSSSSSSTSYEQRVAVRRDGDESSVVVAHTNCLYETNARKQGEIRQCSW